MGCTGAMGFQCLSFGVHSGNRRLQRLGCTKRCLTKEMIAMVRKSNNFRLYLLIVTVFLTVFLLGGCSSMPEENLTKEELEPVATLPPLERILPNDPYLFLPREAVGFQLTFTGEVDPAIVQQSVSFEPELNFTVRSAQPPGEIYLEPEDKLRSDTVYTLQVKGVKNEATGTPETLA